MIPKNPKISHLSNAPFLTSDKFNSIWSISLLYMYIYIERKKYLNWAQENPIKDIVQIVMHQKVRETNSYFPNQEDT